MNREEAAASEWSKIYDFSGFERYALAVKRVQNHFEFISEFKDPFKFSTNFEIHYIKTD